MHGNADEKGGAGEHGETDKAVVVVDAVMFVCAGFSRMSRRHGTVAPGDAVFQHISQRPQREQTGLDFRA
jgi:hypothetical protein